MIKRRREAVYQGDTTDTKPVLDEERSGSIYLELNKTTKKIERVFIWHVDDWYEI